MVLVPEIAWEYKIVIYTMISVARRRRRRRLEQTYMQSPSQQIWRSPEEVVEIGFQRSSVVMMNEAHDGDRRCIRTRQIGKRILPVAHQAGTRYLAMEALYPMFAKQCNQTRRAPAKNDGYLSQPEMREFIQSALDLGWTLIPYEANPFKWLSARYGVNFPKAGYTTESLNTLQQYQADLISTEYTNWRDEQQALNLITALESLPEGTQLLVWCGNDHHSKIVIQDWMPMGYQFQRHSGTGNFVIDQIRTVKFDDVPEYRNKFVAEFKDDLVKLDGTAGFLAEEALSSFGKDHAADAYLFSLQNDLE